MNKVQSPKQRVMTALYGGTPERTPFTVYESMIPQCQVERELRNRGLCIVKRAPSYKILRPNVKVRSCSYDDENATQVVRTEYVTPYGNLSTLSQPAFNTSWTMESLFKSPEDYKSLLFMIKDSVIVPDYGKVARMASNYGEDFVVRDQIVLEPLQALISDYMGAETFCMEWMDNRDEVMKLYEALMGMARKIYPVVADSPLEFANYGGNVVPQIIGIENFIKYFVPHYNEAAEILHKRGKLLGCHFDADNTAIMEAIGATDLDYIEAYDPGISPPVMTARQFWSDKVLWINWPSAWHLLSQQEVFDRTVRLIEEANPGNGFIIGITEDVPEDRWHQNYTAIMNGIVRGAV